MAKKRGASAAAEPAATGAASKKPRADKAPEEAPAPPAEAFAVKSFAEIMAEKKRKAAEAAAAEAAGAVEGGAEGASVAEKGAYVVRVPEGAVARAAERKRQLDLQLKAQREAKAAAPAKDDAAPAKEAGGLTASKEEPAAKKEEPPAKKNHKAGPAMMKLPESKPVPIVPFGQAGKISLASVTAGAPAVLPSRKPAAVVAPAASKPAEPATVTKAEGDAVPKTAGEKAGDDDKPAPAAVVAPVGQAGKISLDAAPARRVAPPTLSRPAAAAAKPPPAIKTLEEIRKEKEERAKAEAEAAAKAAADAGVDPPAPAPEKPAEDPNLKEKRITVTKGEASVEIAVRMHIPEAARKRAEEKRKELEAKHKEQMAAYEAKERERLAAEAREEEAAAKVEATDGAPEKAEEAGEEGPKATAE